jgi:predicted nucleotidyltransferase
MVETTPGLKIIVTRYCRELERMGVTCEQMFLFGSRAKGTAREGSDIDLFVISEAWAPYNERERLEMLGVAAARILEPIQARGATPEEVAKHQLPPFLEQVLREQAVVIA